MNLSVDVDDHQVMANVSGIQKALNLGMIDTGIMEAADELLRLSQQEVPHDEGTLQNSGVVEIVNGEVVVGYHTPYAARLHEHPEYRFQKGRKGKYLEDPINRNSNVLGIKLSKSIGDELGGIIK